MPLGKDAARGTQTQLTSLPPPPHVAQHAHYKTINKFPDMGHRSEHKRLLVRAAVGAVSGPCPGIGIGIADKPKTIGRPSCWPAWSRAQLSWPSFFPGRQAEHFSAPKSRQRRLFGRSSRSWRTDHCSSLHSSGTT